MNDLTAHQSIQPEETLQMGYMGKGQVEAEGYQYISLRERHIENGHVGARAYRHISLRGEGTHGQGTCKKGTYQEETDEEGDRCYGGTMLWKNTILFYLY